MGSKELNDLKRQAVNSIKWTTLQTLFISLSAQWLLIVKARFLTPAEFAALAIVTIFTGLFRTIENFGISQAIIQKDKLTKEGISSLFIFNIFIALVFAFILYVISPLVAGCFSIPELKPL